MEETAEVITEDNKVELNPETAASNSGLYQATLFDQLRQKTVFAGPVWQSICRRGVSGQDKVKIDSQTWHGHFTNGVLVLGAKPLENTLPKPVIFESEKWQAEKEQIYLASHQIAHIAFSTSDDQAINHLYATCLKLREDSNVGLSPFGSLPVLGASASANQQGLEDIAELINWYLIEPDYLIRCLHYVMEADNETRTALSLAQLDQGLAIDIYCIVKDAVARYIGS